MLSNVSVTYVSTLYRFLPLFSSFYILSFQHGGWAGMVCIYPLPSWIFCKPLKNQVGSMFSPVDQQRKVMTRMTIGDDIECSVIGGCIRNAALMHLSFSNQDSIRKAREAYLIQKGKTIDPAGLNIREETY